MSSITAGTSSTNALVSTGDTTGNLELKTNNGTVALTLNTSQAVGVGSSPSYGSSGQVLTSAGSSAAPTWADIPSSTKTWTSYTASGTYTVPAGVSSIRAYAVGAGGNGGTTSGSNGGGGGGGGGGMAYGNIAVTAGQTVTVTISAGVATVTYNSTTMLTANKGNNGSSPSTTTGGTGGTGGTATKDASVTLGGAYTGGTGGAGGLGQGSSGFSGGGGGGGSAGSPLGNGYVGGAGASHSSGASPGAGGGGAGIGGKGGSGYTDSVTAICGGGGGAGGAGGDAVAGGNPGAAGGGSGSAASGATPGGGRTLLTAFTDPLLVDAVLAANPSRIVTNNTLLRQPSGCGGSAYGALISGNGGDFGGSANLLSGTASTAGLLGGGSGAYGGNPGGIGGYGGGGGGGNAAGTSAGAIVLIYA